MRYYDTGAGAGPLLRLLQDTVTPNNRGLCSSKCQRCHSQASSHKGWQQLSLGGPFQHGYNAIKRDSGCPYVLHGMKTSSPNDHPLANLLGLTVDDRGVLHSLGPTTATSNRAPQVVITIWGQSIPFLLDTRAIFSVLMKL